MQDFTFLTEKADVLLENILFSAEQQITNFVSPRTVMKQQSLYYFSTKLQGSSSEVLQDGNELVTFDYCFQIYKIHTCYTWGLSWAYIC